jgi:2-polyprenyl-6-methoxyphenol hydroxylase-like FAD-dependent oxidoreductase
MLFIGAGPAGASLACLLSHWGVDFTLLEGQTIFDREFRGGVPVWDYEGAVQGIENGRAP